MIKKIDYLNALRLLATIFVVLMHTSSAFYALSDMEGMNSFIAHFYHYLGSFAVPVFVMISGVLFLRPDKEITYTKLLSKYVRRIALALLIFGLPMCILEAFVSKWGMIDAFVNFITGNSWTHMWYLYMIICLYLLTPILKPFLLHSSSKTLYVGMSVLFVLSIVFPTLKTNHIQLSSYIILTPFPFYYLVGGYLGNHQTVKGIKIPVLLITLFILSLIARILLHLECPEYADIAVFIGAVGIFLLFKNTNVKWKIADWLTPYCFAIYILHPVFINFFYKYLHIFPSFLSPVLIGIPVFVLLFFILAFSTGWLLRLIPVFKKYVL